MTNLDSISKSRDVTLLSKVHQAMVFLVAMYGCESWTMKKAELQLILLDCGVGEDSRDFLGLQGDQIS